MAERAGLIRVGGRSGRVRSAVIAAVTLCLERGETDLNIEQIAEISGVHKSTIYRRWPTRAHLLDEVMTERRRALVIAPAERWQDYLLNMALGLRDFFLRPSELALSLLLVKSDMAYANDVTAIWEPLTRSLAEPLVAAKAQGAIAEHVDPHDLVMILSNILASEIILTRRVPSDAVLSTIVRYLTDGVGAFPGAHSA